MEILAQCGAFTEQLASVEEWVARRLGNLRHEHRVMRIAVHLFDMTAHLHGLGPKFRRFLKLGALLHDVGRCQDPKKHHVLGARMILGNRTLPLTMQQRQVVGYLARYHRGQVPTTVDAAYLPDGIEVTDLHLLLAIFRAADTLDNRRLSQPTLMLSLKGRRLRIKCLVDGQWRRARRAFARRRKFRMIKELLGIEVKVQVKRAELSGAEAYEVG